MSRTKGLVIVNTGKGKGKTTAALGLMFRAWGHDMKVVMLQFVKHSIVGEHRAAQRMGVEMVAGGAGLTFRGDNAEKNEQMAKELWNVATEKINSGTYDMVILDELTYAFQYGWLEVDEVMDVLRHRPVKVHVIITGRNAPQALINFADTAVEIMDVKHHRRQGIKAQAGIEF
ncbi:MAG: cob(I)yrinic acid a,c-diamide adenosyltransferase [Dehalococcoidales bacterium]|nr:cob(I)yrinic acid a,c-diamide adenosyltransferase [Dehalococcoidales bacterium]